MEKSGAKNREVGMLAVAEKVDARKLIEESSRLVESFGQNEGDSTLAIRTVEKLLAKTVRNN